LTLRHVIDLHLVSARDWHIHIVEGDGTLRVAAQVAHRSQAGAVSAKARDVAAAPLSVAFSAS